MHGDSHWLLRHRGHEAQRVLAHVAEPEHRTGRQGDLAHARVVRLRARVQGSVRVCMHMVDCSRPGNDRRVRDKGTSD